MPWTSRLDRLGKETEILVAGPKAPSSSRLGAIDWQFYAFWVAYLLLVGCGYAMLWKVLVALIQ